VGAIEVRLEEREDASLVKAVIEGAFGGPAEADLVDRLRGAEDVFSLVAMQGGELVGHILFSPVVIPGMAAHSKALGLAPLSVKPSSQSSGIGTALGHAGIEECRRRGAAAVVVLGHPAYYPRFGFSPAKERGLRCKWSDDEASFMALELAPGALNGCSGLVAYHAAFDAF
jgi:putative acetyltransferase